MKKLIVTSVVLFIALAGFSQHLSVNAFGGYTFRDKINFGGAYAYINGGGMWGASVEGVNQQGTALELLYQYQSTAVPVYSYPQGNSLTANPSTVVSYLLLNFEQYLLNNPKIQPYGGIGLGAAFYKGSSDNTSSGTKFAWDLKAGIKFKASSSVGIKIGAQLLGSAQATGTAFYVPGPGFPVYPYTTYATILQFGFTGGLVFDFGGNH
jgi:opacity protein-like surface antigen